jgi:predicted AlkP superfamily phosphohydrolase/phosphomutase
MSADHIHHLAWPDWEAHGADSAVADVYRALDEAVGRLAALAERDGRDTMLVSDHGGGRLDGVVDLNAWLEREGFLRWSTGADTSARRIVSGAYAAQRLLPERVRATLKHAVPGLRERALELREVSAVDWSATRAFGYGAFGNLVVNVRGRERHGIVAPGADYEHVRDDLIARALALESPDGRRIVAAVHRREDLFHGDAIDAVPDLIVEFEDYAWLGKAPLHEPSSEVWGEIRVGPGGCAPYVGSHRHEGIVALSGPSCRGGVALTASIEDICPTIIELLDAPMPPDLDGRPLTEALRRAPERRAPVAAVAARHTQIEYTEAASDEVAGRLRDLGYLE